jgi:hypothetical protein
MTDPHRTRIGTIIKVIANHPGITLGQLLRELPRYGVSISEKTLAEEIKLLKQDYGLLSPEPRLRSGYVLQGMHTIGTEELPTVIDSLWAFGFNLNDSTAWAISRKLGSSSRTLAFRQKNIYRTAKSQDEIVDRIAIAIRDHLCLRIVLESPRLSKPTKFDVFPLFKVFYERGWYLVTRNLDKKAYFASRMDRIKSCEIQKTCSPNDAQDKDITDAHILMNSGWGMDFPHTFEEYHGIEFQPDVVVRFDASVASFIKEGAERHPKAKMAYAPDGSGHLDFRIRLRYYNEFRNWVRSWGSKAWFLEPQSFIDEERTELVRQAWNYGMKATVQTAE